MTGFSCKSLGMRTWIRVWVRLLSKISVLDFTYLFGITIVAFYSTSWMRILLCTISFNTSVTHPIQASNSGFWMLTSYIGIVLKLVTGNAIGISIANSVP